MIETTLKLAANPGRLSAYLEKCETRGEVYEITNEADGITAALISLSKLRWLESRSAELDALKRRAA